MAEKAKLIGREARRQTREYREHRGEDTMSFEAYMTLFIVSTVAGVVVFGGVALAAQNVAPTWQLFVIVMLVAFAATFVIGYGEVQDSLFAIIAGYVILAVVFGVLFGPIVKMFGSVNVLKVTLGVVAATAALGIIGIIGRAVFIEWGGFLIRGLLLLILVEAGALILLFAGVVDVRSLFQVTDLIAIALFMGFVLYDMAMVMTMPKTATNALLGAVNMFLNIVNLIIRVLSVMRDWGWIVVENAPVDI